MIHNPYRCPLCAMVSFNPSDKREGYCGRCRAWTAKPYFRCLTIYAKPRDWPTGYVVRGYSNYEGLADPVPDKEAVRCSTVEEARAAIPPGMYCLKRMVGDDPVILETWI